MPGGTRGAQIEGVISGRNAASPGNVKGTCFQLGDHRPPIGGTTGERGPLGDVQQLQELTLFEFTTDDAARSRNLATWCRSLTA